MAARRKEKYLFAAFQLIPPPKKGAAGHSTTRIDDIQWIGVISLFRKAISGANNDVWVECPCCLNKARLCHPGPITEGSSTQKNT
ncbi:unnamed protein product [Hermetia illucens]|uniref:Uncharacterized protein n=1 Tax=Hermetia illucens TaxID=343691 RepID=A0A7R8YY17_HERIL|nr:unnamed protein product [Hermetia illucens]